MKPFAAFAAVLALGLAAQEPLVLPAPAAGGAALGAALKARATHRDLAAPAPSLQEAAQLLWAAQGENRPGHRTVPSARAKYPLETYLLTAGGAGLGPGLYHYLPAGHRLAKVAEATPATLLGAVKGMQGWIKAAPAVVIMAGEPARLGTGAQASELTYYEAGAAAQDLLLQAAALDLGAGTAVGVDLEAVGKGMKLPAGQKVLVLLPVGHTK